MCDTALIATITARLNAAATPDAHLYIAAEIDRMMATSYAPTSRLAAVRILRHAIAENIADDVLADRPQYAPRIANYAAAQLLELELSAEVHKRYVTDAR